MPPFNSLLGRNKFPVPTRKELPRKVLISLCYLGPFPRLEIQIGARSLLTVSSSEESCKPSVPQRRSLSLRTLNWRHAIIGKPLDGGGLTAGLGEGGCSLVLLLAR